MAATDYQQSQLSETRKRGPESAFGTSHSHSAQHSNPRSKRVRVDEKLVAAVHASLPWTPPPRVSAHPTIRSCLHHGMSVAAKAVRSHDNDLGSRGEDSIDTVDSDTDEDKMKQFLVAAEGEGPY